MVAFAKNKFSRIKNPHTKRLTRDFEFSIYSFLFMILIGAVFTAGYALVAGDALSTGIVARSAIALVFGALVYLVLPRWSAFIPAMLIAQLALFIELPGSAGEMLSWLPGSAELIPIAGAFMGLVFGPSLQVVWQWDKVVVLRLGRFKTVHDPGPFFLVPLLDKCAAFVDTRIRVTDFSAEKILTRDTVPVHVDALAFWMIWDARKAILEVENFLEAVTLSAQTALRDSIGKYSLTTLLSERETLYKEIQTILDAKTNPWGITILSVEFTDIVLPPELEDVMSKQAQAEREKEARLFLAKAEREVADHFTMAAEVYRGSPEALNLRAMNMVYDGIKNNGSLVLLPSGALENMNLGSVMGVSSLAEGHRRNSAAARGPEDSRPAQSAPKPAAESTAANPEKPATGSDGAGKNT